MHRLASSFVLGYHGCDKATAEEVLRGDSFKSSENDYDWLGPGIYFWEANPERGLEYAAELKRLRRGPRIRNPAVVGAIIDLGLCLDLTTSAGISQIRDSYSQYKTLCEKGGLPMPQNSGDLLRRNLDCAVIRFFHEVRTQAGEPRVDSIRGVFTEGKQLYPNAGFLEKTHIQICVCNPANIKGVFRVRL